MVKCYDFAEEVTAIRTPWGKTYQVKCPDGTTQSVYKNINDAFPLVFSDSKSKFSASAQDRLGVVQAKVVGEHAAIVNNLLVEIDERNNSLMLKFRAAYVVYQSNPCREGDYLKVQIGKLIDMHERLTELVTGTRSLIALISENPESTDVILSEYRELVLKLGPPSSRNLGSDAASIAIRDARRDVNRWMGSADDRSLEEISEPEPGGVVDFPHEEGGLM